MADFSSKTPNPTNLNTAFVESGDFFSDHFFSAVITKPEISRFVTERYPQFNTFSTIMERIKSRETVANTTFSWEEIGKYRDIGTVDSVDSIVTSTLTITLTEVFAAPYSGYYLVDDVIAFSKYSGELGRITAIADSGASPGQTELTVVSLTGATWVDPTDVEAGSLVAHRYNLQAEGGTAPGSRIWGGEQQTNYTGHIARTLTSSDVAIQQKSWTESIGGKQFWYYENELIMSREIMTDKEMYLVHGVSTGAGNIYPNNQGGFGFEQFIAADGVTGTFAGALVTEADLQDMAQVMCVSSPSNEYIVMCGSNFLKGVNIALKDYFVSGGVDYGRFRSDMTVGLDVSSYKFMTKTIHFVHYFPWDNQNLFPLEAGERDWSHYSMWMSLGTDDRGNNLVDIVVPENAFGGDNYYFAKVRPGLVQGVPGVPENLAVTDEYSFSIHHECYAGFRGRAGNYHGELYRA